jgi:predicted ester cyclase
MSAAENKALVRRVFEEGLNQNNARVIEEAIAATYVNHTFPSPTAGAEGFKQVIDMFRSAFPDMRVTVEDAIAEGDKVATRGYFVGTHRGAFMGVAATGKPIRVGYADAWRVENGKLVENWVQMDILGLMQQIGAVPAPR